MNGGSEQGMGIGTDPKCMHALSRLGMNVVPGSTPLKGTQTCGSALPKVDFGADMDALTINLPFF